MALRGYEPSTFHFMKRQHHLKHDTTTSLFATAARAPLPARTILIEFDGGANPNPGRGYGSFQVTDGATLLPVERREFDGRLTNNEAEWDTLIAAVRYCLINLDTSDAALLIRGDSQLVLHCVSGRWKTKMLHLRKRLELIRSLLAQFKEWRTEWRGRAESVALFGH